MCLRFKGQSTLSLADFSAAKAHYHDESIMVYVMGLESFSAS